MENLFTKDFYYELPHEKIALYPLKERDMAKLLILSERNIENHRHRLRKKLGVSGTMNLTEYLSEIG